jgi:hypothetical protein
LSHFGFGCPLFHYVKVGIWYLVFLYVELFSFCTMWNLSGHTLHDIKVVTLWLWLSPFTLCKSGNVIFGFPHCWTSFLFAQCETCLITLLHDIKAVTLRFWPSPFTLCKSDDIWFYTVLSFFLFAQCESCLITLLHDVKKVLHGGLFGCPLLHYVKVAMWYFVFHFVKLLFVCTTWDLSYHTFTWCKSCHTSVLAVLFYIVWIT